MGAHRNNEGALSLMDAVEALSTIAETHWEENPISMEEQPGGIIDWKDAHWLYGKNKEKVANNIRGIFKVILKHLREFYQGESTVVTSSKMLEGIKTIMLLVGEAAKKIDRFTDIFKKQQAHSVLELKEYKQLQDFYKRKISRTIDEALLGKWILALTERTLREHQMVHSDGIRTLETKHVFVDLDSVKRDTEYELFFIRKEDGTRFFSYPLIKNIKLVCDFEFYLGQSPEKDLIIEEKIWSDCYSQAFASSVYQSAKSTLRHSYPLIVHNKGNELIGLLNKAIVALLLAASPTRLISKGSYKGCQSYLLDFQMFLRETLNHREFQQLVVFDNSDELSLQLKAVKKIVQALLYGIFVQGTGEAAIQPYLNYLRKESNALISSEHSKEAQHSGLVWNRIASNFNAMQKFLKRHPNGPLNKVLEALEEENNLSFDPFLQQLLPERHFILNTKDKAISIHLLASPTAQEFINKATVIEEFKNFLRKSINMHHKVVLINFQDRTSWREHARAQALEELQQGTQFQNCLTVITLSKDTEFYRQEAPYSEDHKLIAFKEHFCEHFLDNHAGYYFSDSIKKIIDSDWVNSLFDKISKVFFSSRNVLVKEARQNFIELFYLFIQLKVLEITGAEVLYFNCKDGLDISSTASLLLFAFLKMLSAEGLSEADINKMEGMIYLPAILRRERVLIPERFHRMLGAFKVIEGLREELGNEPFIHRVHKNFDPLFSSPILHANLL